MEGPFVTEEKKKKRENRFVDLMFREWETLYVMVSIFSIEDDNPDETFVAEKIAFKNNWLFFKAPNIFWPTNCHWPFFPETLLEFLLPPAPSKRFYQLFLLSGSLSSKNASIWVQQMHSEPSLDTDSTEIQTQGNYKSEVEYVQFLLLLLSVSHFSIPWLLQGNVEQCFLLLSV